VKVCAEQSCTAASATAAAERMVERIIMVVKRIKMAEEKGEKTLSTSEQRGTTETSV
jgi:hypothetical protein